MKTNNSIALRCPYCWNELPKQIIHVAAFPHPLLRSEDRLYQRIHSIIKPQNTIEREITCNNCGRKLSITFFTEIPVEEQSKIIFNICHDVLDDRKLKPWFELFLQRVFDFFKRCVNWIFRYKIYDSSQAIFNYIVAFLLLFIPFFPYLFLKTRPENVQYLTRFDFFLFCCIFVAAFLITQLMELIDANNSKLNLSTLNYGLHKDYVKSRWGNAFEECYLRRPTNEYIQIIFKIKISRPMMVGLFAPFIYFIYKFAFIYGNINNPTYPMFISLSIIPFYIVLFFIMGYSLSYSIIGSPVFRVIARDINLKIDLFEKIDSYQELGKILGKSMMVYASVIIIFSIVIFGMYDSKIMTFNFSNIVEFMFFIAYVFLGFGIFSWIWISALIDLKDKYQNVKNQCLNHYKTQLQQIESKEQKKEEDLFKIQTILFKLNRLYSKPIWPLEGPFILSLLPSLSIVITIFSIMRYVIGINF